VTQYIPTSGLQLRSIIKASGELELSLVDTPVETPKEGEVLVRVEAAPINPSDLGLLLGPADISTARVAAGKVVADTPKAALRSLAARIGQSMPVGNEGAGMVIAAGPDAASQALIGRTVAMVGGAMYAQYRTLGLDDILALPDGTKPADGASCFINPLTALGMVETMRMEGHTALVHTAAASNLGQMLQKICAADGVPLVNIVRSPEQAQILRNLGAAYVLDSTSAKFTAELLAAVSATNATLGFDAIGGGRLASQILTAMEVAQSAKADRYSRYGSDVHKQVYVYGALSAAPIELGRSFGMAWGVGGWLLWPFLSRLGPTGVQRMRQRVVAELKTTFASHYTAEVSLQEALQLDTIAAYSRRTTGEKYLINPAKV